MDWSSGDLDWKPLGKFECSQELLYVCLWWIKSSNLIGSIGFFGSKLHSAQPYLPSSSLIVDCSIRILNNSINRLLFFHETERQRPKSAKTIRVKLYIQVPKKKKQLVRTYTSNTGPLNVSPSELQLTALSRNDNQHQKHKRKREKNRKSESL